MKLDIGFPQMIYIILWGMSMGMAIVRHGQPETGKHNAIVSGIAGIIMLALLYWGGFFT
jgi:LPXTG-motif cell wall-anchored protein